MAPEGYTITAAARALADNYSPRAIRVRMIEEYKRYQKIPEREAAFTFAWPPRLRMLGGTRGWAPRTL